MTLNLNTNITTLATPSEITFNLRLSTRMLEPSMSYEFFRGG